MFWIFSQGAPRGSMVAPPHSLQLRSTQKSPPAAPSGGGDDASGGGVHVIRRRTRASADGLLRGLRVPALRAGRRSLLAPWRCSRPESKRRASAAGRPWRHPRARVARRALRLAARRIARPGGAAVHPNPNPSSALSEERPCAREMASHPGARSTSIPLHRHYYPTRPLSHYPAIPPYLYP